MLMSLFICQILYSVLKGTDGIFTKSRFCNLHKKMNDNLAG